VTQVALSDHEFLSRHRNAAIPFKLLKQSKAGVPPLRLIQADPFLGLPYLATLGFRSARPVPQTLIRIAEACERLLSPVTKLGATRISLYGRRPFKDQRVSLEESSVPQLY
jgi:hypothetical protein